MEKEIGNKLIKVVLAGPESTGKTTLANQLADHFNEPVVEEYARLFLEQRQGHYFRKELLQIMEGQLSLELALKKKAKQLFICDTDVLAIKVWSDFKYQQCDPRIIEQWNKVPADFYFLTGIDVPWKEDPFRENPAGTDRKTLFKLHEQELIAKGCNYKVLSGNQQIRFEEAVKTVNKILKKTL